MIESSGVVDPSAHTVAEAAHRLHVHPRTVRRLIDRGDLAAFRVGRLVRVPVSEVDRLVATAARRSQ